MILLTTLILLQLLDLISTAYILKRGGIELNPVMYKLITIVGVMPALLITKGVLIMLFIVTWPHLPIWVTWVLVGGYMGVVGYNGYQIRRAKHGTNNV